MTKVTMTLDDQAVQALEQTAKRLGKPKSEVMRAAIVEYSERAERLQPEEQARLLAAVRRMIARPPSRPQEEVEKELEEIRLSRRMGWRDPQ